MTAFTAGHSTLVLQARLWLSRKCPVVVTEIASAGREEPDAIGWWNGHSILVECKSSRHDFQADGRKWWRQLPKRGIGWKRYYLAPVGMIAVGRHLGPRPRNPRRPESLPLDGLPPMTITIPWESKAGEIDIEVSFSVLGGRKATHLDPPEPTEIEDLEVLTPGIAETLSREDLQYIKEQCLKAVEEDSREHRALSRIPFRKRDADY